MRGLLPLSTRLALDMLPRRAVQSQPLASSTRRAFPGGDLYAVLHANIGTARVRELYLIYSPVIAALRRAVDQLDALRDEMGFGVVGLSIVARTVELIGVRHIRIVLARKEVAHATGE